MCALTVHRENELISVDKYSDTCYIDSMSNFKVEQGSIYNPGWVVYEELAPRHYRSHGTFTDKSDADDWCEHLNRQETA